MFGADSVNLSILKQRAFNLRWAAVPEGVIPLTAADPDFPCAEPIRESVSKYARDGYFSYGPPEGLPAFREALAANYYKIKHTNFNPSHILPVDSAAFGIYLTCKAFLDKGDEAIIFDPVDFLFRYSVEAVNGVAIPFAIPAGTDRVDFGMLEELITPKTKMICLCNPLNPTGKVFSKEELTELGEIAEKHDLMILSDEIWSDIVFQPNQFTSIASINDTIKNRTITITGFSKSYGLAGLRIGAVLASNTLHYSKIYATSLHQSTVHGSNTLGQIAATTALNECGDWLRGFINHLQRMRDICVSELNTIEGFHCIAPAGCYVAFANITGTGMSSEEVQKKIMEKAKVSVVPGLKQWFGEGAEGYIRLSFATSENILSEALSRIKNNIH
jgi:aspartate/methionine/tyrosine aminotransferase